MSKHKIILSGKQRILADEFEELIIKEEGIVLDKVWASKYNSYVVYDYKPYCEDGFEVRITYDCPDKNKLKFIKSLIDARLNTIAYLNKCLSQENKGKVKR